MSKTPDGKIIGTHLPHCQSPKLIKNTIPKITQIQAKKRQQHLTINPYE